MRFVVLLLALALILTAVWYFAVIPNGQLAPERANETVVEAEEGIIVTKTDITESGVSKLPVGFPRDVPVEVANITESYRAVYAEHGVTQYTVSYSSQKSRDALWEIYSSYMKGAGYTVDTNTSSKSAGQIGGVKGEDTLSAVISSRGGLSLVQLNLLDRGR